MENVALNVATLGDYLPFRPPELNSSYTLNFVGPALQCSNVEGADRKTIAENFEAATGLNNSGKLQLVRTFAAWSFAWNRNADHLQTFNSSTLDAMHKMIINPFDTESLKLNQNYINPGWQMPLQLYVAVPDTGSYTDLGNTEGPATYIVCQMSNSQYRTDFKFVNGEQYISTTVTAFIGDPMSGYGAVAGPGYSNAHGHADCPKDSDELHDVKGAPCIFDAHLARTLSYQAVFDAFSQLLKGEISWSGETNPMVDTQILNTILADSPELLPVRRMHQVETSTLQSALQKSQQKGVKSLVKPQWKGTGKRLIYAMEDLFQKIVVSSMASQDLQ